jgi:3-phenylpropionate/trans-cinnamate dioxygenase ferredoxin reductase subunit
MPRVVLVGGGGTGDACAFALRRRGFDGEILILSADRDRPYDRPYLSKEFLRGEVDRPNVYLHDESDYAKERIELRLDQRVAGGSPQEGRLTLEGGEEVRFDVLVLGLGGTPRRLPDLPEVENLRTLRTLRDSSELREAIGRAGRVLLVGAGFIGAEVAAYARQLGKEVLLLEAAPIPLHRALGHDVGLIYTGIHRSHGVDIRTGTTVQQWHADSGRLTGVTLSDGSREEVDLALIAVGIDPNVALPDALGLRMDGGGVTVDEALRAAPNVYVGGDVAFHHHPVLDQTIRVEHWEVAKGHGRAIAASIAGQPAPYTKVPYFWSDQYDVNLEYRGHASGDDQAVWRGDREGLKFTVFYLRDGLVAAVLSMNDSKTNEAGGKLIESRHRVGEDELASADLTELVAAQ